MNALREMDFFGKAFKALLMNYGYAFLALRAIVLR